VVGYPAASHWLSACDMAMNPLTVSPAFRAFVLDQFEELGDVEPRAMFGGVGLYHQGVFFAIIANDVLYLKVDDQTRPAYEAAGSRPFMPFPGRATSMHYYAVPVSVLESPPDLSQWARRAIEVAERAPSTHARSRSSSDTGR
jgi:DNA transformation protein and related proteins